MFKIGDQIQRMVNGVCVYTILEALAEPHMYRVKYRRDDTGTLGTFSSFFFTDEYKLVTGDDMAAVDTPLDVTKPLQFRTGERVTYIGKKASGTLIVETEGGLLHFVNASGTSRVSTNYDVINVPPPPAFPAVRYVKLWLHTSGTVKVSALCHSREKAEEKGIPGSGYTVVGIQEVVIHEPKS